MAKYIPTKVAERVPRILVIDGVKGSWGGPKKVKNKFKESVELHQFEPSEKTDAFFEVRPKTRTGRNPIAERAEGEENNKVSAKSRKQVLTEMSPEKRNALAKELKIEFSATDKVRDIVSKIIKAES